MILLERRTDISGLLSVADIYVSSSQGESFSNAIGEALACELHCVVTNVGDSKMPELGRNLAGRKKVSDNNDIKSIVKKIEDNVYSFSQNLHGK